MWLSHERLGYNYRMDELSAALGEVQMSRIDEIIAKRQRVADMYGERLSGIPGCQVAPGGSGRYQDELVCTSYASARTSSRTTDNRQCATM